MDLVLDDQMLMNMAQRGDIVKEFPTMRLAAPVSITVRRSCCGGRTREIKTEFANRTHLVKAAIINLPPDKKKRLKEILKVDKLILFVNTGGKGVQQVTV